MDMKKIKFRLLLLLPLCFISCTTSSVIYDVNNYEDGKAYKKGEIEHELSGGIVPAFQSRRGYSYPDSGYAFTSSFDNVGFVAKYKMKYGVSNKVSISAEGFLGDDFKGVYFIPLRSVGGKLYCKIQVYSDDNRFYVSLMPGLGYANGNSFANDLDLDHPSNVNYEGSAKLLGLELLIPMSYQINEKFSFNFGPKFYYLDYYCPFKAYQNKLLITDIYARKNLFCPSISLGISSGGKPKHLILSQEISFILIDSNLFFSLGCSLKFKNLSFLF